MKATLPRVLRLLRRLLRRDEQGAPCPLALATLRAQYEYELGCSEPAAVAALYRDLRALGRDWPLVYTTTCNGTRGRRGRASVDQRLVHALLPGEVVII